MSPSTEQRSASLWLQAVVNLVAPRARVVSDAEGWPMVLGRYGAVEWSGDRGRLWVYTRALRVVRSLVDVPGVHRWQTGDSEVRLWFSAADPDCLRRVLALIRARVRRSGRARGEHMARMRASRRGSGSPDQAGVA